MFTYSLQGLELSTDVAGPTEVEENETTARSAVYQVLGSFFAATPAERDAGAASGRWSQELVAAAELLPFAFDIGEVPAPGGSPGADGGLGADALLGGEATPDRDAEVAAVCREYEYFGLAAGAEGARPADHLATELDFLQYLCFREAATPSPRLAVSFRRAQRDFLDRHVLEWVSRLAERAGAEGAGKPVLWALERLVAFVTADRAYVAARLGS